MPIIEEYLLKSFVTIEVERINTRIVGYVPFKSEALGIWNLLAGARTYFSGLLAYEPNEELEVRGKCQFKDGCINIIFSPITLLAVGAFAYLRFRSASVPQISTAVRWSFGPFQLNWTK